MTEESRIGAGMDPTELWAQWYEMGSKMWSEVMQGAQESYMDPYGLYRQWFENMGQMRDRMLGAAGTNGQESPVTTNPQEVWGKWVEATLEGWQKSAGIGTEMMSMTPRWMQMMDQTRQNLMQVQSIPNDPLELAVQWYNATSGPVSEFVQDVIEREEFLDVSSRFMQNYASLYKIFSRNSEEYLQNLQMPTRSDVTRVAGLVVALEDKVDRLEETFEEFEYGYQEPATADSIGALEKRLDRIENLEQRIDRVEGKLDQLLTAVEGISTNGSGDASAIEEPEPQQAEQSQEEPEEIKATDAARRKAQELGVDLATVEGTGADGQITVGDVREKGDS
ncbi:MAG TPA: E3 binding domain-containing protein [Rubrobacteraceae bacterium]|nr:E3 binding domain-containing protein [Rubrobacteraceae bacterium]